MKNLTILVLLLFASTLVLAENKLLSYEYWFNNDFANKKMIPASSATEHLLETDMDVSTFTNGVNVLNIRYKDQNGKYSSILSKAFVKINPANTGGNKIVAYEYWFNNDFANKKMIPASSATEYLLETDMDVSTFTNGVNVLNIRYKDHNGKYSSILSKTFVKINPANTGGNKIIAYEYWFNNDFANKKMIPASSATEHLLETDMDVSTFTNGVNVLNIRYKDQNGKYSSIVNQMFVKQSTALGNKILGYRYWLDDDIENVSYISFTPSQQVHLMENIDFSKLSKGNYDIHFQFKDSLGLWSVVNQNSIKKVSFPVADFSYTTVSSCDSTIVQFANKSIDGDTCTWDFGDGTTSTVFNPKHIYFTPDNYQVRLTVKDTINKLVSTVIIPASIPSLHSSETIDVMACNSYTVPSGKKSYMISGTYADTISNVAGCDSIISIQLTINTVDKKVTQNGVILIADATKATYQWLDCNNDHAEILGETNKLFTATQNGSYAVEITQFGCVDTSACYTVNSISVIENNFEYDLSVYPNPAKDFLIIGLDQIIEDVTVIISDISSRIISRKAYQNTQQLKMELRMSPGIYLLTIKSKNKKAIVKLIKE